MSHDALILLNIYMYDMYISDTRKFKTRMETIHGIDLNILNNLKRKYLFFW